MDEETLKFFQEQLELELEELSNRGKRMVSGLVGQENVYSDPIDQASVGADQDYLLRIKDRESRLMKKIKNALSKIEDGTFGICEACEEEISIARLKARPVATLCIKCKTQMERDELLGVITATGS